MGQDGTEDGAGIFPWGRLLHCPSHSSFILTMRLEIKILVLLLVKKKNTNYA